jgi:A/G-specific adenine glycosylase
MSKPSATALLNWYDAHARVLPWRAPPGTPAMDPYRVWLSEIMLQQTTVVTVVPYFQKFTRLWPNVQSLADAPRDDILKEWAGLGYYARARNLHKCAIAVATRGAFPETEAALRELPGIGPYTAAAIASIAFGAQATIVDGNVERVISRIFRVEEALPGSKPIIRSLAETITPKKRAGDYAQAIMDLGATICAPTAPACGQCPWASACAARATGDATEYPRKATKAAKPTRFGIAYWLESDGHVWLRRRPATGLLGGMVEIPSQEWTTLQPRSEPPLKATWQAVDATVIHVFTHFRLELSVQKATLKKRANLADGFWHPVRDIHDAGLPTVFAKVAKLIESSNGRLI